jgi:surface protein
MFKNTTFNKDISTWDVSNVQNMNGMFDGNSNFNNGESGNTSANPLTWNTISATDMGYIFKNASNFNQDITGWDVSGVTNMPEMFSGATNMSQNIWVWDVCGNATFTDIFLNSAMTSVQNPNLSNATPDADASANGAGPGTWFTGPGPVT